MFDRPERLDPDRPPHLYMHFGRGMHECTGRDVNALQIPALVAALMRFNPIGPREGEERRTFPRPILRPHREAAMKQSLVTAAVPFDRNKADAVDALLETYIPDVRNPAARFAMRWPARACTS